MQHLKKIASLFREYSHTHVLSGSKIFFFFFFWSLKLNSFSSKLIPESLKSLMRKGRSFIVRNSVGTFFIPRNLDDTLTICSESFESHLTHWLSKPSSKRVLLDIGANCGRYTIIGLLRYNYEYVYAFEPFALTVSKLQKNVELNNISTKATIHHFALGNKTSDETMYINPITYGTA